MRDDIFLLFLFLFLVVFPKMRRTSISFVMSVCLSVRMEQLGTRSKNFDEIWYLNIFR